MAKIQNLSISVKVDQHESLLKLKNIIHLISELHDLVPDYCQHESNKIIEEIRDEFSGIITAEQQN